MPETGSPTDGGSRYVMSNVDRNLMARLLLRNSHAGGKIATQRRKPDWRNRWVKNWFVSLEPGTIRYYYIMIYSGFLDL